MNDQAILYKYKVQTYKYYKPTGSVIKEKYIILRKEKIKVIELSDFRVKLILIINSDKTYSLLLICEDIYSLIKPLTPFIYKKCWNPKIL